LAVTAVGAAAGACGGSSAPRSLPALLTSARRTVNAARAVHFVVTSQNMPSSGTTLQGGSGDLVRPGQLKGSFQASVDGLPVDIKLIEVRGKFYALLPFASRYQVVDPARFGFGDPAALLNPHTGVSGLLTELRGARSSGQTRVNGELLDQVSGSVPGADVVNFLPDVDTSQPVALTFGIDPSSYQVRTVVARGPFVEAGVKSIYRVVLTRYGESVKIAAPPA
jgi:hypothetical protein